MVRMKGDTKEKQWNSKEYTVYRDIIHLLTLWPSKVHSQPPFLAPWVIAGSPTVGWVKCEEAHLFAFITAASSVPEQTLPQLKLRHVSHDLLITTEHNMFQQLGQSKKAIRSHWLTEFVRTMNMARVVYPGATPQLHFWSLESRFLCLWRAQWTCSTCRFCVKWVWNSKYQCMYKPQQMTLLIIRMLSNQPDCIYIHWVIN